LPRLAHARAFPKRPTVTPQVVFEPAAPVGATPAKASQAEQLFPHLYGTIDYPAVTRELPVARGPDGTFLAIEGLAEAP
jgi:uncharacterized protein (DUF952 family)